MDLHQDRRFCEGLLDRGDCTDHVASYMKSDLILYRSATAKRLEKPRIGCAMSHFESYLGDHFAFLGSPKALNARFSD